MVGNKYNFQKLTPINQVDLNIYKSALEYVFENNDIKNVGISGAYSAGKSSIIETYKKLQPDIKFMHISLAYFQSASTREEPLIEQNENVLEGKILNQLIHQIDPIKIPQTNFRVKRQLLPQKLWSSTLLISLFILSLVYIFNFGKWAAYEKILEPKCISFLLGFTTAPLFALFAGVICATILIYMIFQVIKVQFNKNLFKGISVQGNTIEIFEQGEESYFDKYLNEVLYLFENSGANVIVFEDMDRYNTNQIFQRLREINTLINSRKKSAERPLRFFYLLRDDIFVSKERTKFFDFIMPIVPILDGSNSFDQFIAHFKKGNIFHLFEQHFLQEISLYIDDMRILKNIYNEFLIYHERISTTEQDPDKLLAMIIYKNIFPRDFSDLQLNRGFVHTLFSKKDEYILNEKKSLKEEIDKLNQSIIASENEHLQSNEEIDTLYNPKIQKLRSNYSREPQIQMLEQEKDTRKENIKNRITSQQETIKQQINLLESTKDKLQNKKLHEIINKQNADIIFKVIYTNEIGEIFDFNEIKGSDYFPLIKYLIKKGYIDETYPDYMTYFYEHSLSRIDKIFLRSVTDEDAKEYTYKLKSPEIILSRLSAVNFDKEEVLNFDLLAHLLEHQKGININKMIRMLKQIQKSKNFKFISLYFESNNCIAPFVKALNSVWTNAFESILAESNFMEAQKKTYALESLYHNSNEELETINSENVLTNFISNSKDFLNIQNPNIQRIVEVFGLLDVKFFDINYESSNNELFRAIYSHNFYVICFGLICLILMEIYGCTDENTLKHKNYTLIISKPDEPLMNYIEENFVEYVKVYLENCEDMVEDSEEAAVQLLNNGALEIPLKVSYIDKLQTSINSLEEIEDTAIWIKLINCHLVVYSENNVLQYFCKSGNGLDKYLVEFINEKGSSFHFNYDEIDNNFEKGNGLKFLNAIVKSEELNLEAYASILEALRRHYTSFNIEGISDLKMDILINQKVITMTPEVLAFMRVQYPQKIITLIKKNIQIYSEKVISQENFDFDEMLDVLETDIDDEYKFSILRYTHQPISVRSDAYSDELKAYILQNNFCQDDIMLLLKSYPIFVEKLQSLVENIARDHIDHIIDNEFLVPFLLCKKLIAMKSLIQDQKLQLFAITVENFTKSECKECLTVLELNEYLRVFLGKRPTIPATEVHKLILDIFKKKQWIAGYDFDKKDDSLYRVSSKRIPKQQALPIELL